MTVASYPDVAKHTDMMRRLTVLDQAATYKWLGLMVRIETNSAEILRAAIMAGFEPMPDTGQRIDHRWELVIERESGTSKKSHSVQVSRQDQMAMIEIGEHGWFGLDLDSGDGAGFVDKRDSEDTLHIYFSALTDVIKPWLQDRRREAAANG